MQVAKRVWVLRGFLVVARYGTMTVVGCRRCVHGQCGKELLLNLATGWWSIPWGLGTPFVVLQNLIEWLEPASDNKLEAALRNAAIDPEDVREDGRGFTGEQRRMLDAAYAVLGHAILADGRIDPRELDLACAIVTQLTDGRLGRDEMIDALLLADPQAVAFTRLRAEYRSALLRMALDIAKSDGVVSAAETEYLRRITRMLGARDDAVEEFLRRARARESAPPRRPEADDPLHRALACLEVSDPTDILSIKAAYRRLMLRYHPDRAAGDPRRQAEHHRKAQEINWAYDHLLRHAGVR